MGVIYLIRHGQASFLKEEYDQLSELGINQSKILGESLKNRQASFAHMASGTMQRHQQTAIHCLESLDHELMIQQDDRWNEYDHMELLSRHDSSLTTHEAIGAKIMKEENPMRALQILLNDSIHDWMAGKHEYTQSWNAFKENSWNAINDLAQKLAKGQNACVFTSGGPISAILMHLLSLRDEQFIELQGRLVNSSVTKILAGKKKLSLSTYNEYSHLDRNPNFVTYR